MPRRQEAAEQAGDLGHSGAPACRSRPRHAGLLALCRSTAEALLGPRRCLERRERRGEGREANI